MAEERSSNTRIYLKQWQVAELVFALGNTTVKELKKHCPIINIPATWYNKAKKTELVSRIAFTVDMNGATIDFIRVCMGGGMRYKPQSFYDEAVSVRENDMKGPQYFFYSKDLFFPGSRKYMNKSDCEAWTSEFKMDGYWDRHSEEYANEVAAYVRPSENRVRMTDLGPEKRNEISNVSTDGYPDRFTMKVPRGMEVTDEWRIEDDDFGSPSLARKMGRTFKDEKDDPKYKAPVTVDEIYIDPEKKEAPVVTKKTDKIAEGITPAPAPAPVGGLEAILGDVIKNSVGDTVRAQLQTMGITEASVKDLVLKVITDKTIPQVKVRTKVTPEDPDFDLVHKSYDAAKFWLDMGQSVYLNGPAGSGKTVASQQLAESYKNECTIISCHGEMTVYDLCGYRDGNGRYNPTPFYHAWVAGRVIVLDEVDKSPGEVNVFLNAATAQGIITFPNGEELKKKDTCKIILTGNTKMSGADAIYSAGQRQDGSFSNRLVAIDWQYDENLEESLAVQEAIRHGATKQIGKMAYKKIIAIRKAIEKLGMTYVVGQRQTMMVSAGCAFGRDPALVFEEVVYGWMDSRDADRVKEKVGS